MFVFIFFAVCAKVSLLCSSSRAMSICSPFDDDTSINSRHVTRLPRKVLQKCTLFVSLGHKI
jgi:hypothetical protein